MQQLPVPYSQKQNSSGPEFSCRHDLFKYGRTLAWRRYARLWGTAVCEIENLFSDTKCHYAHSLLTFNFMLMARPYASHENTCFSL